jgi:DNA-binding PadR family transcriptional regulator
MAADTSSFLPLRPAELLLLVALSDDDLHGYALAREIAERSDGIVKLEPGNLYRVIKRLVDDGLVAESGRRSAPDADAERRNYYKITPLGARVAAAEAARLRALLATPTLRRLAGNAQ